MNFDFLLFIVQSVQDSCRLLPIDLGPTKLSSTDNWSRRRRRIELAIIESVIQSALLQLNCTQQSARGVAKGYKWIYIPNCPNWT